MRIAIVGGGIAGLASAVFQARAGRDITVFETMPRIAAEGTGILLQPAGFDVLRRLDLGEAALSHGCAIERIVTRSRDDTLMDLAYAEMWSGLHALGIRRPMLAALLLESARAAGANVHFDLGIEEVEDGPDAAWVRTRDTKERLGPYDLVLICNGMFSKLRGVTGAAHVRLHRRGVYSLVAPLPEGLARNALLQRLDGMRDAVGLLPIGRGTGQTPLVSFFWNAQASERPALEARGFEAWRQYIEGFCPEAGELLAAAGSFAGLTFFSTAQVTMPRWHGQRTLVIGDAAHALDPHLGLGATMALLDAECLEECLHQARNDIGIALPAYQSLRQRALAPYARVSRVWSHLDGAGLSALRRRLFLMAARRRFIRRRLLRHVCGYADGAHESR
jgi:2-polyprenyl-6-methoxyphenol hydroxylase-like FAD-dependent oxidoreductase